LTTYNAVYPVDYEFEKWKKYSHSINAIQFKKSVRCIVESNLEPRECEKLETPLFYGKLGVFVTIKRNRQVRGCYGSYEHKTDDFSSIIKEYSNSAIKDDPRYYSIEYSELKESEIIITIARNPSPIPIHKDIDFKQYGIFIHSDSTSGFIYVPGEIRTKSSYTKLLNENANQKIEYFSAITIRIPPED
jgi:AMMECR1 domain-containing protein